MDTRTTSTDCRPIVDDLIARAWATDRDGQIMPTPTGTDAFAGLLTQVTRNRQALVAGIGPEEYAQAISVFSRMARNLGWEDSGPRSHAAG